MNEKLNITINGMGTVGFGCSSIGRDPSRLKLLDLFLEMGGCFLDTANSYGNSEEGLGEWMKERGNRDSIFISTKVGFNLPEQGGWGLTAKIIEDQCEQSLRKLKTDRIDLYYSHYDDRNTPLEETLETYDKLIKAGKVLNIGASNIRAWRLAKALGISRKNNWAEYCSVQNGFSYLRPCHNCELAPQHPPMDVNMLDLCKSEKVKPVAFSPLLGGAYTRNDKEFPAENRSSDSDARLKVLNEITDKIGCSANQTVLAWMRQSVPSITPLVRASNKEQLCENMNAIKVSLDDEQIKKLTEAKG